MDEEKIRYIKEQYDYMVFMILVKTVGFVQSKHKLDESMFHYIIDELNVFYSGEYIFDKSNIIDLGKKIIDEQFAHILEELKIGHFDPELEITNDLLKKIKQIQDSDKNCKNGGYMLSDYQDGKYYRIFLRLGNELAYYDNDRNDVGLGETLYHSLSRFGSEGVDEYFNYFKIMCEANLVNYKNQNQQNGFCNCNPCIYWLLSDKEQLEYFNYIIENKDIKLNHICGNERGPSEFGIITDMIYSDKYWNRKQDKYLHLDNEFRELLYKTLYNISKSNFSIGFDKDNIIKLLEMDIENSFIENMFNYLLSPDGIEKQYANNNYPIYLGGTIDRSNNTDDLNKKYNDILIYIREHYDNTQKRKILI